MSEERFRPNYFISVYLLLNRFETNSIFWWQMAARLCVSLYKIDKNKPDIGESV